MLKLALMAGGGAAGAGALGMGPLAGLLGGAGATGASIAGTPAALELASPLASGGGLLSGGASSVPWSTLAGVAGQALQRPEEKALSMPSPGPGRQFTQSFVPPGPQPANTQAPGLSLLLASADPQTRAQIMEYIRRSSGA